MKSINRFTPTWVVLHRIYGGLIGKALFIISLASPLILLKNIGITIETAPLFLTGAALVAFGFILEQLFVPVIPKAYSSPDAYAASSLERLKGKALDLSFEFSELSNLKTEYVNELLAKAGVPSGFFVYFPPDKSSNINTLGEEKIVYYSALINYQLFNTKNAAIRFILSILFASGIFLIYKKTATSIILIISGGIYGN